MPNLRLVDSLSLPYVWRVEELASEKAVLPSGHASLDAQLPGGGWPVGSMVEVLQERPSQHAWRLLLPGLAKVIQEQTGPVVLVSAPFEPFGPSLHAQGFPGDRLICIRADKPAARLWAAEQALRCAEVAAVLAWLPQAKSVELRRLNMAAQQHAKLLFVFRGMNAGQEASPARLRLSVEGGENLEVRILKRRGPPMETPLTLPAYPERLGALLEARRGQGAGRGMGGSKLPALRIPIPMPGSGTAAAQADKLPLSLHRRSHVLDRTAANT